MKKAPIIGGFVFLLVIGFAVFQGIQSGVQSPMFASGTISFDSALGQPPAESKTLFITVFDANSPRPMPYGAMRETVGTIATGAKFEFFITPERLQIMNPAAPYPQKMRIKARLDKDGLGGVDQPGDLVGEVQDVAFGSKNIVITIAKKI